MAKKTEELALDTINMDSIVTDQLEETLVPIEKPEPKGRKSTREKEHINNDNMVPSCLRNERIIIRRVPRKGKYDSVPGHVMSGGMAENAHKTYVVPRLQSGVFVNVLTNAEKSYLEDVMGLEHDALSIYNRVNNFWEDSNEFGISSVTLNKQDNYLDLSIPEQYIKYKILLANKNLICPSMDELENRPKATYEYVIISEHDETNSVADKTDTFVEAIEKYSTYKNDQFALRTIMELLERRRVSQDSKIEFLRAQVIKKIQENSKAFLKIVEDPLFDSKLLIKKAVNKGLVADLGGYFYYKDGKKKTPLCDSEQDPTLENAAKYINLPRHQEILFALQAAANN